MKTVEPGEAADQIVDAVRRNYHEITVPSDMYYTNKVLKPKAKQHNSNNSSPRLAFDLIMMGSDDEVADITISATSSSLPIHTCLSRR